MLDSVVFLQVASGVVILHTYTYIYKKNIKFYITILFILFYLYILQNRKITLVYGYSSTLHSQVVFSIDTGIFNVRVYVCAYVCIYMSVH